MQTANFLLLPETINYWKEPVNNCKQLVLILHYFHTSFQTYVSTSIHTF